MKVPKQFLVDAVSTTCFLINRMPSPVLSGNALYNVLFLTTSLFPVALRLFRSTRYVRDLRFTLTKLDPKGLKCVFVGYSRHQKGCRCYFSDLSWYLLSTDATFSETTPFWYQTVVPNDVKEDECLVYKFVNTPANQVDNVPVLP